MAFALGAAVIALHVVRLLAVVLRSALWRWRRHGCLGACGRHRATRRRRGRRLGVDHAERAYGGGTQRHFQGAGPGGLHGGFLQSKSIEEQEAITASWLHVTAWGSLVLRLISPARLHLQAGTYSAAIAYKKGPRRGLGGLQHGRYRVDTCLGARSYLPPAPAGACAGFFTSISDWDIPLDWEADVPCLPSREPPVAGVGAWAGFFASDSDWDILPDFECEGDECCMPSREPACTAGA